MTEYTRTEPLESPLRIPLTGEIDLTYRCNNDCRHCWNRIPPEAAEAARELSAAEIERIVLEARAMGCRDWGLGGGEPMLREDFAELFDFITRHSRSYTLNTNGTLITPRIAGLLRRRGQKLVALYGATPDVWDKVTRTPGSCEAFIRGVAYLKEAGAGFTVQVIPMRDNYRQFDDMLKLARSLSSRCRIGAPWLFLSAGGDPERNREIRRQRLKPSEVVKLDQPDLPSGDPTRRLTDQPYFHNCGDDRLFAGCIAERQEFHIDPYGTMSFCGMVREPALRYDLRQGSFRDCWENFIPSLAAKVCGGGEYLDGCGRCELRDDCRWCPAYAFLEHRRHSARVDYLCSVARETRRFKENWRVSHRRYYRIAGITIQVDSDLPISGGTFDPKFKLFEVEAPGDDLVSVRHHFSLPELEEDPPGREVYRRIPWAVYRNGDSWIYLGISPAGSVERLHRVAVFNDDHTRARIYSAGDAPFRQGGLQSLTQVQSDQIMLARVLADRRGCYMHSGGVILDGAGLLFVGHSEAGKSTIVKMMMGRGEVLCDDRIIVRKWDDGFRIHGTWSNGEVPLVSAAEAPLRAVMFLVKDNDNFLAPIEGQGERVLMLADHLVKPLRTPDWWDRMLDLMETLAAEVPCYKLHFDRSGGVVRLLEEFCRSRGGGEGLH